MIAEISAGFSSLKAAKDIIQGLNAIKTQEAINEVKINLQSLMLDAQQGLFAAQEREAALVKTIAALEQEIVDLKDWQAEKRRYELKNLGRSSFAYMVKPAMREGEPPHWLCTNCFDSAQKSIMQYQGRGKEPRDAIHGCNRCKATIIVHYATLPEYAAPPQD